MMGDLIRSGYQGDDTARLKFLTPGVFGAQLVEIYRYFFHLPPIHVVGFLIEIAPGVFCIVTAIQFLRFEVNH